MTTKKTTAKSAPKSAPNSAPKSASPYVIVRGSLATFSGYLKSRNGQEVTLSTARIIGYWEKRHTVLTLAQRGPGENKLLMSDSIERVDILDATTVIYCSEVAAKALREKPTHEVP